MAGFRQDAPRYYGGVMKRKTSSGNSVSILDTAKENMIEHPHLYSYNFACIAIECLRTNWHCLSIIDVLQAPNVVLQNIGKSPFAEKMAIFTIN